MSGTVMIDFRAGSKWGQNSFLNIGRAGVGRVWVPSPLRGDGPNPTPKRAANVHYSPSFGLSVRKQLIAICLGLDRRATWDTKS